MKTDILGVAFDALTLDEAEERADALLRSGTGGYIVTANPEIVLHCREDAAYAAAVNGAALVLADGVGDLCAARILGTPLPERVTGADLVPRLLSRLAQRSGSVFLYGARPGVAQRAGEKLKSAYPGLRKMGIFPMKRRFSQRWNRKNPICCCLVSARRGRSCGWRETGRK